MKTPLTLGEPVTFTALEWTEPGWKSGHPVLVLDPVLRYFEDNDIDSALAEAIIDVGSDFEEGRVPQGDDLTRQLEWRGWRLDYLRRVVRAVPKGKEYPVRDYHVEQRTVRFDLRPAPGRVLGQEVDIVEVT